MPRARRPDARRRARARRGADGEIDVVSELADPVLIASSTRTSARPARTPRRRRGGRATSSGSCSSTSATSPRRASARSTTRRCGGAPRRADRRAQGRARGRRGRPRRRPDAAAALPGRGRAELPRHRDPPQHPRQHRRLDPDGVQLARARAVNVCSSARTSSGRADRGAGRRPRARGGVRLGGARASARRTSRCCARARGHDDRRRHRSRGDGQGGLDGLRRRRVGDARRARDRRPRRVSHRPPVERTCSSATACTRATASRSCAHQLPALASALLEGARCGAPRRRGRLRFEGPFPSGLSVRFDEG